MGVMQCSRKGCENVLCHRFSREYGYICTECFDELKTLVSTFSGANVGSFMATQKPMRFIKKDENLKWLEEEFSEVVENV